MTRILRALLLLYGLRYVKLLLNEYEWMNEWLDTRKPYTF